MKNIYLYLFLLSILFAGNYNATAQCDPVLRPDSTHLIFNGAVLASAKLGNTLYLGGSFTRISRNTGSFVKVDGLNTGNPIGLAAWPKVNGTVRAVVSDGTGGWIIAGQFTQVGSSPRNMIAQINAAGQVTTWNPGANNSITALYRNGTTLYVGGIFTTIGGQSRDRIASFNLLTGNINAWNPGADGSVNSIAVSGSNVFIGGAFTTAGGQSRNRIAAIDAATGLATSWNPNISSGSVNKILIDGSTVYFGGSFSTVGGLGRSNVAAAELLTGNVKTWNPSSNGTVFDLDLLNSNVLITGSFTNIGSQARVNIAEVDDVLGNATSRNFNMPSGGTITAIKISGNYLYAGGTFTVSGKGNLLRANLTTNTVDNWESNYNATVYAIEALGNDLYVGGAFTQHYYNRSRLAAIDWLTDAVLDWAPVANSTVYSMQAQGTDIYIGGAFTTINSTSRPRLALLDNNGQLNSWLPNPTSTVYTLLLSGNTLFVGGAFNFVNSQSRNRLAAFDITNHTLTSWDPRVNNGQVQTMAIAGGNIYVGGTFTSVSNPVAVRNRIASFSLSTGALTGWNPNADGSVNSIIANGSNIYAGGTFSNIGGQFRPRLAALAQATSLASAWSPYPNNDVYSIAIEGNTLFAAGAYQNIGGQSRDNIAGVDLTTGNATTWNPSANGIISYVAVHSDRLILGGSYSIISGQSGTPFAAQYNLLSTTPVVNITGNNNVCASTSVTYTAVTAVAGATYQWKKNSVNVGSNSATYTTVPVNGDQVQCVITTPMGSCYTSSTANSNTITVSVTSPTVPTISVSGNTTVCLGTATTYTATTNITGGTLQWKVNGNNTGNNSTTFTYTPNNNDVVTCTVTTPATGCYSPTTATSAPQTITVNAPMVPTVSISTPNTTICNGTSITFTATTNVTGASYLWRRNTTTIGTNSPTLTTSILANNDIITCVVTIPAGGCYTTTSVTSPGITMTVNPNIVPGITISGNISPCGSASTTYTANTNVTGGTYQWKVNNVNVGTNNNTYTFTPTSGDVLTCEITTPMGSCYTTSTANSNSLAIFPLTPTVPTALVTGSNNLCAGQTGTYTVFTNVAFATYQWKVNNVNVGTNSNSYSYVPVNGDVVTCLITTPSFGCYTTPTVTSNSYTLAVNSPALPTITITTPNTTVCSGVPVTFDGTNNNVPGGSYQWRVNNFSILGATNSTFTYFPSNGDVVTCAITVPPGGCYLANTSFSGPVTMNVTPSIVPVISVNASANNVCMGSVVNYSATTNITGGTYQWRVNGLNVGTNASTYSYSPVDGDVVTCVITVPGTGCYTAASVTANPIFMQVNTPVTPQITVAADNDTTCEGNTVTLTATTNITGGTYLWKVNGFNVGSNSPTHSYVPQNNDIVLCTIITPTGCYTTSSATSLLKVMKVKLRVPVVFELGVAPIVELGATVFIHTPIPAGITNYSIEWKRNGTTFATTTTNNASYTKAAGVDTLTAVLTTSDGCYTPGSISPARYVYSVGVGVNDVAKQSGIEVFPNPFSDRITVKGMAQGDKLVMFDMAGRIINPSVSKVSNGTVLTLNDIAAGAYLLKVHSADGNLKANIPLRKL